LEQAFRRAFTLESFGRPGGDLGLGHRRHGVAHDHLVGYQEAEELVPRRPSPGDAGGGVVVRVGSERPAQALRRQLAEAQLVGLRPEVGCQASRDGSQVAPVGGLGVRRALEWFAGYEEVLEQRLEGGVGAGFCED
jgi:hypothetical protein